jgi:cyclopropane-fatty-acyl-phospholipid synthase
MWCPRVCLLSGLCETLQRLSSRLSAKLRSTHMFYRATLEHNLRTRSAVPLPQSIKEALVELFSCLPLRVVIDCWGVERLLIEGPGTFNKPVITMAVQHPGVLKALIQTGDPLVIAEAYVTGNLDIGGAIDDAILMGRYLSEAKVNKFTAMLAWFAALQLPALDLGSIYRAPWQKLRAHSKERDAETIRHHYDVGNDFYSLWLDPKLLYSCAFFKEPNMTLEQAQEEKLDTICRKLQLQPGDKFLDIGCGWGALLRWAAEHYGVEAHGITLSEEQYAYNIAVNAAHGLSDRVHVRIAHYTELPAAPTYDKISSVGMIEHVGIKNYPIYFQSVFAALRPGGLFLNHGISSHYEWTGKSVGERFIERYIFPDGELGELSVILNSAEQSGWEIVDVESWRPHYVRTLRCWADNLERSREEAVRLVGQAKYQLWRLYLIGSALSFQSNDMSIFQTLLRARDSADWNLPMKRAGWLA